MLCGVLFNLFIFDTIKKKTFINERNAIQYEMKMDVWKRKGDRKRPRILFFNLK